MTFHWKESHKNGKDGDGGGCESFLKRFHVRLGWREYQRLMKSQIGGERL